VLKRSLDCKGMLLIEGKVVCAPPCESLDEWFEEIKESRRVLREFLNRQRTG